MISESLSSQLGIGTAQFGNAYGINNKRGKIPEKEAQDILQYAWGKGISLFDTSPLYGESHKVIGDFVRTTRLSPKIITKLSRNNDVVEDFVASCCEECSLSKLYALLIHDFSVFRENPELFSRILDIKNKGYISKAGFSLYYPQEVDYLISQEIPFDIIQVPYSIFDQRFSRVFDLLKERGIEIHARSVFLQGLIFKPLSELEIEFAQLVAPLESLHNLSREHQIPFASFFLNFVLASKYVDTVILGIDSILQLQENISSLAYFTQIRMHMNSLFSLAEQDENIILPTHWKQHLRK